MVCRSRLGIEGSICRAPVVPEEECGAGASLPWLSCLQDPKGTEAWSSTGPHPEAQGIWGLEAGSRAASTPVPTFLCPPLPWVMLHKLGGLASLLALPPACHVT